MEFQQQVFVALASDSLLVNKKQEARQESKIKEFF
jgi:hypothetical protein